MKVIDTISFIFSCISALLTITGLITFFVIKPRKKREDSQEKKALAARELAIEKTETKLSLDYIKLQNETILAGNAKISEKLDSQSERLTVLETIVKSSHLAELPERVSKVESVAKSAHKRIDDFLGEK